MKTTSSAFPFETLIKGNAPKSRDHKWYPTSVDDYKNSLKIEPDTDFHIALRCNLSYNLQYLEFLQKELDELEVSAVLESMIIKNYVITGMSILEGIFAYVVKENGWWTTENLEEIKEFTSNATGFNHEKMIVKSKLCKVIPERDVPMERMSLHRFIQILDKHHEGLSVNHIIYKRLNDIRDLRNKIHLTCTEESTDHDYNAFNREVQQNMQKILYEILTSKNISHPTEHFEFLNSHNEK